MKKKSPKKTKTNTTAKAKKVQDSHVAPQPINWDQLYNTLSFMYKNLTSEDLTNNPMDQKNLSKITTALNEAEPLLFSIVQNIPKNLFNDSKEETQFSNELNHILHGLKHLSSMVNKHLSTK